jgi:hypothetical protein
MYIGLFKLIESNLANNWSYCIDSEDRDFVCQDFTHDNMLYLFLYKISIFKKKKNKLKYLRIN